MKSFVIFSVLFVSALASILPPGEITLEVAKDVENASIRAIDIEVAEKPLTAVEDVTIRIAGGVPAKKGENLDLCILQVTFLEKSQTCGCFIWDERHVITTGRCVVDCTEKMATNITVTFPQNTKFNTFVEQIYVHPGYAAFADVPHTNINPYNLALLKLAVPIVFDNKTIIGGQDSTPWIDPRGDTIANFFTNGIIASDAPGANAKFRACGVGVADNKGAKSKGVTCVDINVINPNTGSCIGANGQAATLPPGILCIQSRDEANLCVGDFGGPIYAYSVDEKGVVNKYKTIGLAIGSPDVRSNAPCLGGQTVYAQYLGANIQCWISYHGGYLEDAEDCSSGEK